MTSSPSTAAPRILIHLPNWLGDVIMTTPLLEFLSQAFAGVPDEERPTLHLAVRKPWSVLFEDDPRLSIATRVHRSGEHGGIAGLFRLGAEFRRGAFDAVVLGPPSLRAGITSALAGIPVRVGHATDGRGWFLKPGLGKGPRGSRHFSFEMLELGLALLAELGIDAPELPSQGLPAPSLPGCGGMEAIALGERKMWVVAPGTTYGEAKTWPLPRMAEFVERAANECGAQVILLGDEQVAEFVSAMRSQSGLNWGHDICEAFDVVDLTGRTDLVEVVKVLKAAAVFIGNDSGLMHLAAALGRPCIGIFGSSNPDWTHPLGEQTVAVVAEGFDCRPCYRPTCNQSRFCMETITSATVLNRVEELLSAEADSAPTPIRED